MPPSQPHRHAELDAIRGIILLLVLTASYVTLFQAQWGHTTRLDTIPPVGFLALQLFLAVCCYRLAVELSESPSVRSYVLARVLRYLPALWPAVALTCAVASIVSLPVRPCPDLASLAANLLTVPDFFGLPVAAPCLWRLKLELLMSVTIGAVWFALGGRISACIVLLPLGLQALLARGADPVHLHTLTLTGALTLDGYLPACAFGLAVFHLRAQTRDLAWRAVAAFSLALLFLIGAPAHQAWVAAALLLFALAAFGRLPVLARAGWLRWLGRVSFPTYVVHQVPGFVLIRALEAHGTHPLAAIGLTGVCAVGAGALIHYGIEVPVRAAVPRLQAWRPMRRAEHLIPTGLETDTCSRQKDWGRCAIPPRPPVAV